MIINGKTQSQKLKRKNQKRNIFLKKKQKNTKVISYFNWKLFAKPNLC